MYHPYLRGKQFELVTIRESAGGLADAGFVPIIEPVKESLGGLHRTIQAVCDAGGSAIVVVNPYHGDHAEDGVGISGLLQDAFTECDNIAAGILLKEDMAVGEAIACFNQHADRERALVHAGFGDGRGLADALGDELTSVKHVFFESCGMLYRRHFQGATRILLKDGFERRQRNRDYPAVEPFSDLHVTYPDLGGAGFGDFLTVGDDYSEGGGPAYAVAIQSLSMAWSKIRARRLRRSRAAPGVFASRPRIALMCRGRTPSTRLSPSFARNRSSTFR